MWTRLPSMILLAALFPADAPVQPRLVADLARELHQQLKDIEIALPGGSRVESLLTIERLERCLQTVDEAAAWPEAWLIVEFADADYDLLMPIRLDDEGGVQRPEPLFAAPRREWDVPQLKQAIRDTTGRKPKGRTWNLVIQGFSTRIVDRYVYDVPAPAERGLMALLPAGGQLREARRIEHNGSHATLALVLREAEFLPSSCENAGDPFGHADTGTVELVLASQTELLDVLDLTGRLAGRDGRPLLARYACRDDDRTHEAAGLPIDERFGNRELVSLIALVDDDGDGRALEFTIPSRAGGGRIEQLGLGVRVDADPWRLVAY